MKHFFAWWKEHDRIYVAIFWLIQLSVLALATAAWYFWGWPYGIVALIWLRSNAYNYAVGSQRFIDDELKSGYPEFGIKEMFKSSCLRLQLYRQSFSCCFGNKQKL